MNRFESTNHLPQHNSKELEAIQKAEAHIAEILSQMRVEQKIFRDRVLADSTLLLTAVNDNKFTLRELIVLMPKARKKRRWTFDPWWVMVIFFLVAFIIRYYYYFKALL